MIYKGTVVLTGEILCKTGLHIGGGNEAFEIGGLDKPVIRHPHSRHPYIPGSSLKGKMRSLLELALDRVDRTGNVHKFDKRNPACGQDCPVCRIFGAIGGEEADLGPARLVVRDATLRGIELRGEIAPIDKLDRAGKPLTEIKTENTINRIQATSGNMRQMERVPAGAVFDFELVFRVFEGVGKTSDLDLIPIVVRGMKMLVDDTLGGSGSRGYGQIEFRQVRVESEDVPGAQAKFIEALPAAWRASA